MAREKKQLSKEQRQVLKAKQDKLKAVAVRKRSDQLNAAFRIIVILGFVLTLLTMLTDYYEHEDKSQTGYGIARDILTEGKAFVETNSVSEPLQKEFTSFGQSLFALLPFLVVAFLVMYAVDWKSPLGPELHVLAVVFAFGMALYMMMMAGAPAVGIHAHWPGLAPGAARLVMLSLLLVTIGGVLATPGAKKRIARLDEPSDDLDETDSMVVEGETMGAAAETAGASEGAADLSAVAGGAAEGMAAAAMAMAYGAEEGANKEEPEVPEPDIELTPDGNIVETENDTAGSPADAAAPEPDVKLTPEDNIVETENKDAGDNAEDTSGEDGDAAPGLQNDTGETEQPPA